MRTIPFKWPFILILSAPPAADAADGPNRPLDFVAGHFPGERVVTFAYAPDMRVHVNAPEDRDPAEPTHLIVYALPNGNTIEQTVGKRVTEGVDWHFGIQHIGAQTRLLRRVMTDRHLVVSYVEAEGLSWPRWRAQHPDGDARIASLMNLLRTKTTGGSGRVHLVSHSGGGSFVRGIIESDQAIPSWIERIVFLDSNYGIESAHTDALAAWLQRSERHVLVVIAYDDRRVKLNGKRIVSRRGGTFRRTREMANRLARATALSTERTERAVRYRGMNGRIDMIVLRNPDNRVLHTVLVERNGLVHGLTSGGPFEDQAGVFFATPAYAPYIQDD